MVSKKSFTLLVDKGTIPFFAVVPIISYGDCRSHDFHIETCFMDDQHIAKRELHAHCSPDVAPNLGCL